MTHAGPYESVAAAYEHGRPAYADEAIEHIVHELGLEPGASVIDLGAGTGKLTRMLVARGMDVTALDPSPAMLARLRAVVPEARAIESVAELIPLPTASADAVTAAQAFHWFDAPRALEAMHRVLRPGGGIALVWNRRDPSDPVQRLLNELTAPPERATPRGWELDVPAIVAGSGLYGPVSLASFRHFQPTSPDRLLDRLRSSSFVAGLSRARRDRLEARLRERLEQEAPVTKIAFATLVHVARRA